MRFFCYHDVHRWNDSSNELHRTDINYFRCQFQIIAFYCIYLQYLALLLKLTYQSIQERCLQMKYFLFGVRLIPNEFRS